MHLADALI